MPSNIPPTPSPVPSFVPPQAIPFSLFLSNLPIPPLGQGRGGPGHFSRPRNRHLLRTPGLPSKRNWMPTNRGGKMRGWDITLWTSTSSSIANHLRKKVGDRSFRRFTTTAVHQIGGSPANAVDGEKQKTRRRRVGILYPYFDSSTTLRHS